MAEDLKHLLIETNQEFRELASRHHSLEDRLHELETKHFLSDAEQFEEISLKKRKLQVKDRMEMMLRTFRTTNTSPGLSA
ncbi:MAG TPA: YdcH family protein [Vicinamibacterales bacterium]|nr:YdcH family protein [Vicinamibacterales bacterium]